jgi:hypothetical protein
MAKLHGMGRTMEFDVAGVRDTEDVLEKGLRVHGMTESMNASEPYDRRSDVVLAQPPASTLDPRAAASGRKGRRNGWILAAGTAFGCLAGLALFGRPVKR